MVSLNDALMELVTKKLVAPDEAYSKAVDKTGFEGLLKRAGLDHKPKTVSTGLGLSFGLQGFRLRAASGLQES